VSQLKTPQELAERVRHACYKAAQEGYESASISGLCAEGALEAALSAIDMLDLEVLLAEEPSLPRQ